MKIEGQKYLNESFYDSITISDKKIIVKSNDYIESVNDKNSFTNNLKGLSDEEIKIKVVRKFLDEHIIVSVSEKLKYNDKEYRIIKSRNGCVLKIYGNEFLLLDMINEKFNYDRYTYVFNNNKYDIDYSNKENSYNIVDGVCYIKLLKDKKDKIDGTNELFINELINNIITKFVYLSYDKDNSFNFYNDDVSVNLSLNIFRKYAGLIEKINNNIEKKEEMQLKMKGW